MTAHREMLSPRRTVRKDVLRNRALLLESADALIREHGMKLSLNAVAHHAGVGVGTVYRHFPDRDALVHALFAERVEVLARIMTAHLDDDDPVDGLRSVVFEVCEMQARDRGVWEVMSSGRGDAQRDLVDAHLMPVAGRLVDRANATGRLRTHFAVNDLPVVLWTGGALTSYLSLVPGEPWRRYVQLMFEGFLADDDPARRPLEREPLDNDQIDAAMRAWRPSLATGT